MTPLLVLATLLSDAYVDVGMQKSLTMLFVVVTPLTPLIGHNLL